jgi:hypothetical protein
MTCLSCANKLLTIYNFGKIPLVNSFNIDKKISNKKFTLNLKVCEKCKILQLANFPKKEKIFKNYKHTSSGSSDNLNHLNSFAKCFFLSLYYLFNAFNQEIVFSAPWDFGFALRIYSRGQVTGGAVIDSARGLFHDLKLLDDEILLDSFWRASPPNLWLYRFDPKTQQGSLAPMSTPSQLRTQLLSLGYLGELGRSSTIELGSTIDFSKPWMARHQFIGPGWFSEIESWGGIWSAKNQTQLVLPMPTNPPRSITFIANALVTPKHPQQRVEILLDGDLQKTVTLKQANDNQFTVLIPQALQQAKTITIDLRFLDAISPQSLGMNADARTLALGLKQIRFD